MTKIAAICATQGEMGESLDGFSVKEEIQLKEWQKARRKAHWGLIRAGEYRGMPIVLARTGIWRTGLGGYWGNAQAREVAKYIIERYQPEKILIFGTSGGVQKTLNTGDIVVCNPIYAEERYPVWPFSVKIRPPIYSDNHLLSLALEVLKEKGIVGGDLQIAGHGWSKEKRQEIWVVEMEDYWIASVASKKKIPFLAVRVVLEPFGEKIIPKKQWTQEYQSWYKERFLRVSAILRNEFLIPLLQRL